jgi:HNH endonuclease
MTWPSFDEIDAALAYDATTGEVVWKMKLSAKQRVGDKAGYLDSEGYWSIQFRGKSYKAHRLAWLLTHGKWPELFIDHINGDRADNRIENLREASRSLNAQNQRKPQGNSKSGVLGVSRYRDKWKAQISNSGRVIYLGLYASTVEASAAYLRAKRELHAGCVI